MSGLRLKKGAEARKATSTRRKPHFIGAALSEEDQTRFDYLHRELQSRFGITLTKSQVIERLIRLGYEAIKEGEKS